ncbi:hypothetical protein VIOR103205_12380 [Vibrio ordalii]
MTSDFNIGVWFDICLRFISPVILAIIVATKLNALFTEGYGGYDLTLGWIMIGLLFAIGVTINATSRKECN